MEKPPALTAGQLEALCKVLGETDTGLTGTEIGRLLAQASVRDVDPAMTKWKRLFNALAERQNEDRSADRVFAFIRLALDPARYVDEQARFEYRRTGVNAVFALCGFEFRPDGRFAVVATAHTLSETEARANRLRAALSARAVHPDVIASCRAELMQNNAFHAVLEASKSVAEDQTANRPRIRRRATCRRRVLGSLTEAPNHAFSTESQRSEQRGFANLVKGLFGVFRNPVAHTPRSAWDMADEDALDLFTLASYVHRRVDSAHG